jgi:hypothetical protein
MKNILILFILLRLLSPNGELSGSTAGCRACSARLLAKGSNDLFGRANQRAVGLIGRVPTRNSPFGRAQRDRTINILDRFIYRFGYNDTIFLPKNKQIFIEE